MIKVAHIADLHCCKEHQEEALKSLHFLAQSIKKSPVDFVAIAGDTWDASMLNTEASGFNGFIDAIRNIADEAPVAMIYGTPSHDTDGSLEVFRKINCKYSITILEPAQSYILLGDGTDNEIVPYNGGVQPRAKALILGVPEPRKKYMLANATVGKDETESAIRDAMQKLCFMLAAKRRERACLPCVMLYHGDVAGCSLQNDRTVERGTGVAITIDDLAGIGADYYALGHIHKPQQVGTLPAYYAGSIYPKDFGETHISGFNIVEMEAAGIPAHIQRVDFPHPQNMKIEGGADIKIEDDFSGKRVWLDISCTKEERVLLDEGRLLAQLKEHGAVDGSRVTISDIPTETVRAAEITQAAGVTEKYKVWAENSGIELKDSVLKKIAELDAEISKDGAKAHGAWELVSLKIRGSIGLKKGIHKDEISIDFDSYDSGLIALIGENGKGKTTLIENCHPYPQLLTRKGKLQDHFCLRDSFREVVYRDRDTKRMVKCLIQIDGENKTGSCNYYAYTSDDCGKTWEPVPGVDKNSKPYEDFVAQTFGPMELFLRTAFITQRPTKNLPDLTDATAGEKKTLFVELAGIDYLQRFADAAGEREKQASQIAHDAEIKAQMLLNTVSRKADVEQSVAEAEKVAAEKQAELEKVTSDGKTARTELNTAQERATAERDRAFREKETRADADKIRTEISSLEAERARNESAAKGREENEKLISEYEVLQKTVNQEQKKRSEVNEKNSAKMSEYLSKKSAYDAKCTEIEKYRDGFADQRTAIERDIANARNDIKLHERDVAEIKDTCPTCGQKLPADKIAELEAKRANAQKTIKLIEDGIREKEERLAGIDKKISELTQEMSEIAFEEPARPKQEIFDSSAEDAAVSKMNAIDISRARADLETAKTAAVRIDGINAQFADKAKLLEQTEKTVAALEAKRDGNAESALSEAQSKLDSLTEKYTVIKSEIAATNATIEAGKKTLSEIADQETELAKVQKDAVEAKAESTEWELVSKAFGKDGIQALELDALAPGISETANRLLESAYGERFSISIETTRIGGSGKSRKQIEDFKIMVTDDGETTTLENKSGGEAVWIKRAIYDAFAVIRGRNTGFAFLTCFQDETDGALDASAKTAYCRMLEASHEAAKLRHTIIITHSNEVKAMVEQKIAMESL
ncbi:hypothetical protein [uncultured Treponema sp.]|uniref:hypothetical protein n=1 Tax=uncultured Treponema sp. TaxID=162155 RepID=UPI00280573C6|nr:hypothetical protein [uncultured Treponema sp.]